MQVHKELLRILVCPQCRFQLTTTEEGLLCEECSRLFPVVNGIPVMLMEESKVQATIQEEKKTAPKYR